MPLSRKQIVTPVFYCVEGSDEFIFLKILAGYFARNLTNPKIISNGGGSAQNILDTAIKRSHNREYTKKILWLDNDLGIPQQVRDQAETERILIYESSPCFEAEMFRILEDPDYNIAASDRRRCKKLFKDKYLGGKSLDKINGSRIFTEEIILKAQDHVQLLNKLIESLRGRF